MKSLRLKTYLTLLPIVFVTVAITGYMAFLESRQALTRLANRHLAYKADQLRDYVNSEWEIVSTLGLGGEAAYRQAQEESFRSYAYSLLRGDSELILVLDAAGRPLYRIGASGPRGSGPAPEAEERIELRPGWFSAKILGEGRVGIAFAFEPFGWTIAISEPVSLFYSDIDAMLRKNLAILAAALLCSAALSAAYLRRLIGPLERLAGAMASIGATGDLALRAAVEFDDEIGALARRFNTMIATLESQNRRLAEATASERKAHAVAVQREVETLFLLGRIADYNDEKTGSHLKRIGSLSALFARLLGQDPEEVELLRNSAPLHDLGKIAIPESILNKPGRLDAEEFRIMKRHTTIGHELLGPSQSRYLSMGATIAYSHHERWDGGGYPRGLSGAEIPLAGRIVSVVDVFDALVSDRPYKAAWSKDAALAYIGAQRGLQFDPSLVDLFLSRFPDFERAREEARDEPGT
ncbi:MAG: HD domain-containing protein [Spirochaetaceae bacterium]|nr:HD domain-containing protein [Spirochaetaceae bacterium]